MRKILFCILLILSCKIYAFVGSDSLILSQLTEKEQISYLLKAASDSLYDNLNRAKERLNQALEVASKTGTAHEKAEIYISLGEVNFISGEYMLSKAYYKKALELGNDIKDKLVVSKGLMGVGINLDYEGKYRIALQYMHSSLQLREQIGDIEEIATAHNNISRVYYLSGNTEEAITHIQKALEVDMQRNDSSALGYSYSNLATYYYALDSLDKALDFQNQALKYRLALGDPYQIGHSYNNLGNIFEEMELPDSAEKYYQLAIRCKQKLDNEHDLALSESNLGSMYFRFGYLNKALFHLNKAQTVLEKKKEPSMEYRDNLRAISRVYEKMDSMFLAYKYLNEYVQVTQALEELSSKEIKVDLGELPRTELFFEENESFSFVDYYSFGVTITCLLLFFLYFRK